MTDQRDIDPDPPASRRFSTRAKLALALTAMLGLGAVAQGIVYARHWLAHHELYTISLSQIELSPPPPSFLRGGSAALLANLAKASGKTGPIHMLDQDLEEIADLFRVHCPWVAKVTGVEWKQANRLIVSLDYRVPAVRLDFSKGEAIAIDDETHVLPIEDLTLEFAAQLTSLRGISATGARPGLLLETANARMNPDPEAMAGIHLAKFLSDAGANRTVPGIAIYLHKGARRIFLKLRAENGLWLFWGEPPGEESKGLPSAADKLARLKQWYPKYAGKKALPLEYLDLNDPVDEIHKADPP